MMEMNVSREVQAPAAVVWEILIDLEGATDRITAIEKVEILSDTSAFEVGLEWRETRTMFGRSATEDMKVIDIEPGQSYTVEADPHGSNYKTVMSVASTGSETSTVSMEFSADPHGLFQKLLGATVGRLMVGSTKKAIAVDLDDIAAAAEVRS